jgi:hypothetical protein
MAYESLPYIGGDTNSPEWQAKREELFEKRGGKCEHCGRTLDFSSGKWRLHHKDNDHRHNSDDNLEILCTPCHFDEHPNLAWSVQHKPLNFELASALGFPDEAILLEAGEYLQRCFSRGHKPKWYKFERAGIKYKETDDGVVLTLGDEKCCVWRYE